MRFNNYPSRCYVSLSLFLSPSAHSHLARHHVALHAGAWSGRSSRMVHVIKMLPQHTHIYVYISTTNTTIITGAATDNNKPHCSRNHQLRLNPADTETYKRHPPPKMRMRCGLLGCFCSRQQIQIYYTSYFSVTHN